MPIGILFGALLYALFVNSRTRARCTVAAALVLLYVVSNTYAVNAAFRWWEFAPRNIADVSPGHTVGIVLTGGMIRMVSPRIDHPGLGQQADRFLQAYLLYKAGKIQKILISGAHKAEVMQRGHDDGRQAARLLMQWGVPARNIILERASRNTHENAAFTAKILRKHFPGSRNLLITSSFHLRRAMACFQREGVTAEAFPADFYGQALEPTLRNCFRPDPEMWGYAHMLWREWIGYGSYKAAGYL